MSDRQMPENQLNCDMQATESHQALIARLYREHNETLIRFLTARVGSEQEARDVAQEAYVRMLQLDSNGAKSFLSAYLFRTATNIAIDRLRGRTVRARAVRELSNDVRHSESPDTALETLEQLELIEGFMEELPPKCRQAFYWHRLQDMSPPDIAAKLGIAKRTVHHYLVQAMVHVRMRLDETTRKKDRAL